MTKKLSRRAFVFTVGGGLAGLSLAWSLGGVNRLERLLRLPEPARGGCCAPADYQGWMVTPTDKEKLILGRSLTILEDTDLPGRDIASGQVSGVEECESWCLSEEGCLSFTYAKPDHPDPAKRDTCWIKDSDSIRTLPSPFYVSGVVD
jgi:hypothetical protein